MLACYADTDFCITHVVTYVHVYKHIINCEYISHKKIFLCEIIVMLPKIDSRFKVPALCTYTELFDSPEFPCDVKENAKRILEGLLGQGIGKFV